MAKAGFIMDTLLHKYIYSSALAVACSFVVMLLCAGCGRDAERLDERDRQHPMMRRALDRKDAGDIDAALGLFERVIEERPAIARAHLEAAMLYDTHMSDYIRAIYHYQRYLDKRPKTEKRDLILGLITAAELSFAAALPNSPEGALDLIGKLQRENAVLRDQLARAGRESAPTPARAVADQPRAPATPRPPAPEPAVGVVDLYTVERGDTLTRIAHRFYGDSTKWTVILEANSDVMKKPEDLRIGQRLVIPEL